MICPLDHEDEDYRFGAAKVEESIILRICPKCGIVFVADTRREEEPLDEGVPDGSSDGAKWLVSEKQILKWP